MTLEKEKGRSRPRSLLSRGVLLLSRRDYSRKQLRERLLERLEESETAEMVDETLDVLEKKGYLSEQRFAEMLCRTRSKRYGNARLSIEMRQAGLSNQVIEQALGQTEDESQRASEVWKRRFGKAAENEKERARQIRFLVARGFPYDIVFRVIKDSKTE